MPHTDLQELLDSLRHNLNILQEREAKFGLHAPLDLVNQIADPSATGGTPWLFLSPPKAATLRLGIGNFSSRNRGVYFEAHTSV